MFSLRDFIAAVVKLFDERYFPVDTDWLHVPKQWWFKGVVQVGPATFELVIGSGITITGPPIAPK